jgi:ABC-type polysaccharide/polyol phosphate transport system ATPase subunit
MIVCTNLSKKFRWYDRPVSLKETFARVFRKSVSPTEWYVLKGLELTIAAGERVGILGKNGSGKTTLLKILAGIYAPTTGTVTIDAQRMLALIELGAGFYADLTGRENIRLNWTLNGLRRAELEERLDSIIEFSGIRQFLDTPLKYFSAGMRSRLAFSIAIHADPDLLILDEVLAVGDAKFQEQCYAKIESLCRSGTTLLLVSHNMADVQRMCSRAIWVQDGGISFDGAAQETVRRYLSGQSA